MATFDLPELPESRVSPQLMLGAASPLWAYFGAAAAGGVAFWWMTRWTRPVNLEAMFAGPYTPTVPPTPVAAATEAALVLVETVTDGIEAAAEAAVDSVADAGPATAEARLESPVDDEAVSPPIDALSAPEPEATSAPVADGVTEAAKDVAAEAMAEAAAAPEVETQPLSETTADPLPAPAAKARVRKTPPDKDLEA
ncbi:MAG: hypothetical protein EPN98_22240 [Phenylobacterium sp.]|uniref:hypothetical protein n=1 Tax=Phenylobacterium sp. TaxID=1871053 RepID=UPI00120F6D34|nr:hypothetical protein [Phenylobacterium sp.]TAL28814.1 MAG: hypothetical protein EPN98_22240 [Phenylobacterium sp.]